MFVRISDEEFYKSNFTAIKAALAKFKLLTGKRWPPYNLQSGYDGMRAWYEDLTDTVKSLEEKQ